MAPVESKPPPERGEVTLDEADEWAERERNRRAAWLAGPSGAEKRDWARRHRRCVEPEGYLEQPTDDEVDEWAERETARRQRWLAGPTDEEKEDWQMGRRGRAYSPSSRRYTCDGDDREDYMPRRRRYSEDDDVEDQLIRRYRHEDYLMGVGLLDAVANWPHRARARLVQRGLEAEYDYYTRRPYGGRVPYEYYPS